MNFERGALSLVMGFVAILIVATLVHPPAGMTSVPKVRLGLAVPAPATLPAPPERTEVKIEVAADPAMSPRTTRKLSDAFAYLGYKLDKVLSGGGHVPRLFLASLPADMADIREAKVRKALFFKAVLPLILQVNEEILADRRRLWRLRYRMAMDERIDAIDRLWLIVLAEHYKTRPGDMDGLLNKVDVIPPSLALAQAAEESGWGTSRFVREGNAIFGQWTFSEKGNLKPRDRDLGKTHNIRAFNSLLDSVKAYARNLNTHRAYRGFRKTRAAMRVKGRTLNGKALAGKLKSYSQRGSDYVAVIRTIIIANGLDRLDDSRLSDHSAPAEPLI